MNRRTFASRIGSFALLAFAGGFSLSLTGCNVFSNILNWIPVGLSAIDSIITLLGPLVPPPAIAIIVLVKAAFADLSAAISQYNADTNPADKSSLLAKIKTLLSAIADNFQKFLDALNLGNNPIVAIVIGLANIILSAIMGFMGQLPAIPTTKAVKLGTQTQPVVPKTYKTVAAFKADFNKVAVAGGHPEIELK